MKKNYSSSRNLLILVAFVCFPFFMQGQITFHKVYGTTVNQSSRDILPTSDGYLIAGVTEKIPGDSDIYIVKTNLTGDTTWTKTYGGNQPDYPYRMLATSDGNYFIVGFTASRGAGSYDIWLLKMNPAGDTLWTKTYGGAGDDQAKDIIATSDGNYVITGRSNGAGGPNYDALLMKINPTGGIIWSHTYGGSQYEISHSVKQCADGGFVFTGQTLSSGMGLGDVYLVKTNSLGVVLWSKTYGGTNIDEGNALVENSDGSIVICAETSSFGAGNIDVYAIKTDSVGTVIWSQTYGGNDKDISHDIQHTSDGNYVIAAISRSFGWINPDMWIVKIADATGDTLWTKHYGSWYHDHCYTVKQTTDGGFIAIGHQEDASSLLHIQFVKLNPAGDIGPLSVNELASDIETSIYPNPTDGIVNIDWDATSETGSTFKINNALGQIIYSETIDSYSHSNHKVIDLRDRKPGVYFVTIQTAKNLNTKKLILR